MKIINFIAVFVIAAFFAACNSDTSYEPADAVFSGNLTGAENQQLYIRNETINKNDIDTIFVGADGSFSYKTFMEKPGYFTFFVGRNQMSIYMKPGDSLMFDGDIMRFEDAKFSGNSVVYNNYLRSFARTQSEFGNMMQFLFTQPEKEAVAAMDSLRTEQMNNLLEIEKNFKRVDKNFIETEKNRIKYFWGLSHVMYPLYFNYYNSPNKFEPSPEYDNYLAELNINDSSLISLPEYRQFVHNYLSSKTNSYFEDSAISDANPSFTVYQLEKIKELFTDPAVRSYLSYRVLRDHVMYDGIKDYDLIWPLFEDLCKNDSFKKEITDEIRKWDYLRPGSPAKDFAGVTIKGDSVHLSDFKGKYVYVDVWATWCKPCLGEIPDLTRIEEEMKDNNIVFISASVDRDKSEWEKMMNEREMHGVQIYVGNSRALSEFYMIKGIPRFMLFDRDGNILEVSAERPSQGVDKKLLQLEGI